jgi:hypothetical protein
MLPPIDNFSAAEMIRDGGSLAASFHCTDGVQYWLYLEVILQPGSSERLGYSQPQVVNRLQGTAVTISWQHALALVHQLQSLSSRPNDPWLSAMEESIKGQGRLPLAVSRLIGQ